MLPTPTPIVLSDPTAAGSSPVNVLIAILIMAVAVGLQVLLFYRRRKLAQALQAERGKAKSSAK
ncbi:MAG: hypothetical protein U0559_11680 [Anaerolineae bacterium]